jgi:iron complex transport system substrate-binding protein
MNIAKLKSWFLLIFSLGLAACAQPEVVSRGRLPLLAVNQTPRANLANHCVAQFNPAHDYFPDKVEFKHSTQLSVAYHGHYKLVRFKPGVDTGERMEYLLVQCGAPRPAGFDKAVTINVPINSFVTENQAMLSATADLGIEDRIVGIASTMGVTVPSVVERIKAGQILDVGGGTHSTIERILEANPDVLFTFYSAYPEYNEHPKLWEMGIRAVGQADHMESHPLGRAEWLKFLALLTNQEAKANELFAPIEQRYQQLAAMTANVTARPQVLFGEATGRDTWERHGGRNHLARLVWDAGGEFFSKDEIAGSWVLSNFEEMYERGEQAAFWIGGPQGFDELQAFKSSNPRNDWFRPVREGRVFTYDKGNQGMWKYPWVDQGMTKPHLVLADVMRALHPELLSEGETRFVRKLQ